MVTNKFYWNWKKLPSGIRPFGFFILMPPLKEIEDFVDQSLPSLVETKNKSELNIDDFSEEEQKQRAMKRQLAKLKFKNETPDKLIPA